MSTAPYSRRAFLAAVGLTGAAAATHAAGLFGGAAAAAAAAAAIPGPASYTASWDSVDRHPPAPEWFQDAKFGIYFHWGVFSVPAYDTEWYPRHMYVAGSRAHTHHVATYGEPSAWPYHNFIDGERDKAGRFVQFAPRLASAGGRFDPDEWAQLFADAGAKFAGPVAEHHDGFSMWDSEVNEWNSVDKGPRLDLLRLFSTAIRAKNMKLLVAMHHAYNMNGFYDHVPAQSDPSLCKLYGQLTRPQENQLWFDKLKEVIDQSQPDILWQDFTLDRVDEAQRLKFLAYYYNQAVAWDKEVVATYKDGFNDRGEVFDYERGGPADIRTPYWLTDDSISSSSWSYTTGIRYYSATAMLHALIDRVSKNGNMVLNIAPMADGTIPQGQRDALLAMGDYLRRFGESIYSTRAWSVYGEGPTQMGGGIFQQPQAGTAADIRYTRNKAGTTLYATVLGWPGNGARLTLSTLAAGRVSLATLSRVELLGATAGSYVDLPTRTQTGSGLQITLPSSQPFPALAYVVKLTFAGQIPTPAAATQVRLTNVTSGLALDSGGNVASGTPLKQYGWDGSTNLQWRVVDLGNGYHRLINRTNGMAVDGWGDTTVGAPARQATPNSSNNQQWRITDVGGGRYVIANRTTGLVLDGGGRVSAGAPVKQWTADGSPNLQWTVTAL